MRPKAFFFDVFGTVVEWRSGVAREAKAILAPLGHSLDWFAFADAWRNQYQAGMEEIRSGRQPFARLDVVHRRNLERILPRFGLDALTEEQRQSLVFCWHRLDAWPDSAPGMQRLHPHAVLAPVSNGNIALMVALARHNRLPFDAILGAELAGDYKPKPRVYLAACEALGLAPADCMMVAAHSADLAAAAACGLRTGHVARPNEHGPGKGETAPSVPVDVAGRDMLDLAAQIYG
jgi:2-haloacid dehalogenase